MKPSVLILAILVVLGIFAQEFTLIRTMHNAKKATDAANRAWIAPVNIGFPGTTVAGKPIRLDITVDNVGKEPARDVQKNFVFRPFPISAMKDGSAMNVVAKSDACKDLMPSPQALVIYPGGEKTFHASWYPANIAYTPPSGTPPFGATPMTLDTYNAFMNGKQALVVQACVAYTSLGKRRYSAFCHYYVPGYSKGDEFNSCDKGNYTDE
jgi:hypothetical protein